MFQSSEFLSAFVTFHLLCTWEISENIWWVLKKKHLFLCCTIAFLFVCVCVHACVYVFFFKTRIMFSVLFISISYHVRLDWHHVWHDQLATQLTDNIFDWQRLLSPVTNRQIQNSDLNFAYLGVAGVSIIILCCLPSKGWLQWSSSLPFPLLSQCHQARLTPSHLYLLSTHLYHHLYHHPFALFL